MEKELKRMIFDLAFTEDIRHICLNEPPAGSEPEDFSVAEDPKYGVLTYSSEKEAQALDILFIVVGRAWLASKEKELEKEN